MVSDRGNRPEGNLLGANPFDPAYGLIPSGGILRMSAERYRFLGTSCLTLWVPGRLSVWSYTEIMAIALATHPVPLTTDADGVIRVGGTRVPLDPPRTTESPLGRVLEDLILMIECSLEGEFEGRIEFLPLRNS